MQMTGNVQALKETARAALAKLEWRRAALLFTAAADNLPEDPHGNVTADEQGLRRDAHLALCRTEEFKRYRHRWPSEMSRDEWLKPDGDLVMGLLAPRRLGA
jgi:protoheme ferro-lyase